MIQPINRETAIALAEEAGAYYAAATNPGTVYALSAAGLERLCNLVAAHLRKAAEPVAKIISSGPAEADKLLQQALEALEYRLQQTRPIHQADSVMEAIRTYLEGKK